MYGEEGIGEENRIISVVERVNGGCATVKLQRVLRALLAGVANGCVG